MILLDSLLQDVRYGLRAVVRTGRFTLMSLVALALGIGVNTAVFTAYKAFVLRPIDARDPDTMVNAALRLPSGAIEARFSYPDYEAYRDQLRSFRGVIAVVLDQQRLSGVEGLGIGGSHQTVSDGGGGSLIGRLGLLRPSATNAEFASTAIVSENYFAVLGVGTIAGRTFDAIGARELASAPAVLISENYWQRRFGSDPAVLGSSIRLNGAAFTVAGITPHDFTGNSIAVPDFWLPISLDPLAHPDSHGLRDRERLRFRVHARLAPGVTMMQAQAEMEVLAAQLRALHAPGAELSQEVSAVVSPGSPLPAKPNAALQLTIALIMAAVGMVLVIACANAASLQLARATTRQQELGMRLSLGASRSRLIRQLLTESALLGLLAGALALPLTWAMMHVAVTRAAEALPVDFGTLVLNVRPDLGIFAYVFAISMAAGILFGLAPAIDSSRTALFAIIRGGGTSPSRGRLRQVLIAAQVAVSLALMIAGGLLVRSANQTLSLDTGYRADRVIDLHLRFPEGSSYSAEHKASLVRDLRARLAALPGVATMTSARAPNGHDGRRAVVSINGEAASLRNQRATLYYTWVQPNYFETLGVTTTLAAGASQPEHTAIVSEAAARRLWPGQNPIGRSLRLGTDGQFHNRTDLLPDGSAWQVIGVARDTRGGAIDGGDAEQVYLPLPADRAQDYPLLVRTTVDPRPLMRAMEGVMASVDPDLIATIATLEDLQHESDAFLAASMSAAIASTISFFGLLLASMGIYGTVSYLVVLRTREVGIRLAIGAQRRDILLLMIRESAKPVLAGLLAGIVLAIGAARLLRGVLYGLSAVDAIAFAGASLLFLMIAALATWLPSRRAMRIDPLVALRYE